MLDAFGSISYGIAIVIFIFAYIALRPSLRVSPIPREGAPLITTGIYDYVRHPMYLAVTLIGVGLTVRKMTLFSVVSLVLLIATLFVKARYEDSLLSKLHPDAKSYQTRTRWISVRRFRG